MAYNKYRFNADQVRVNKQYTLSCIDVTFINNGTATAYIENLILPPGASFSVQGNLGEICTEAVNISFDSVGSPLLQIVQRSYAE